MYASVSISLSQEDKGDIFSTVRLRGKSITIEKGQVSRMKGQYPNPRFASVEEEEKYWQRHSPLAEGYEGTVQHKRQKRSSYLALRLNGEELKQLRDAAQRAGIGPTTLARNLILRGLETERDLLPRIEALEQKVESLSR